MDLFRYNMGTEVYPFRDMQVVDYGDIPVNPFNIPKVPSLSTTVGGTYVAISQLGVRYALRLSEESLFFAIAVLQRSFVAVEWSSCRTGPLFLHRELRFNMSLTSSTLEASSLCCLGSQAIDEISSSVGNLLSRCEGVVIIGGDHTISYPSLKVGVFLSLSRRCVAHALQYREGMSATR